MTYKLINIKTIKNLILILFIILLYILLHNNTIYNINNIKYINSDTIIPNFNPNK